MLNTDSIANTADELLYVGQLMKVETILWLWKTWGLLEET
jgi:hypothetical protein